MDYFIKLIILVSRFYYAPIGKESNKQRIKGHAIMILRNVKKYLHEVKTVSLFDLSKRFNIDASIMREMLKLWINKGQLERVVCNDGCGVQCSKCAPELTEVYRWLAD